MNMICDYGSVWWVIGRIGYLITVVDAPVFKTELHHSYISRSFFKNDTNIWFHEEQGSMNRLKWATSSFSMLYSTDKQGALKLSVSIIPNRGTFFLSIDINRHHEFWPFDQQGRLVGPKIIGITIHRIVNSFMYHVT